MIKISQAQKLIVKQTCVCKKESIPVGESIGRVVAESLYASIPYPAFTQSTHDGFVVGSGVEKGRLSIIGSIAAGSPLASSLKNGEACKIMTGGLVPEGGERVIPLESVSFDKDYLYLDGDKQCNSRFIHQQGSEIAIGDKIVKKGSIVRLETQMVMTTSGVSEVRVFRKPRVSFFCTGSELVDSAGDMTPGKKISTNHYLLGSLISSFGGLPSSYGIVLDKKGEIEQTIYNCMLNSDIIITTGGMGPGDYDLMEKIFLDIGGRKIFNRLNVRPGKSVLFGVLQGCLFFALPGPPFAVRMLFDQLIRPALVAMQGVVNHSPASAVAVLQKDIFIKKNKGEVLKGGVVFSDGCENFVRLANSFEPVSCYIRFSGKKKLYKKGERVNISLTKSPFYV